MTIPYNKESILNLYPDILVDGKFMLDIWESYTVSTEFLENEEYYVEHIVTQYDRWDRIAQTYYDDRSLWWVLALTNSIEDPFAIYFDYAVPSNIKTLRILKIDALRHLVQKIRDKRLADDVRLKQELKVEES